MLTIFHSSLFLFFPLWTRRLKMHFEQRCAKRQSAHFKSALHIMGTKHFLNSHLKLREGHETLKKISECFLTLLNNVK